MLPASLTLAALLLALGPAAPFLPPRIAGWAGAALCVTALSLAVASLVGGGAALTVAGLQFRLDGLAGWSLLSLFVGAAPALLRGDVRSGPVAGAMLLAVLAADVLAFGLALAGLCAVLRVRRPVLAWAGSALLAMALLGLQAGGRGFEAIRAAPPEGTLAVIVLVLAACGLVALGVGLLRLPDGFALAPLAALGFAIAARITLDLCGAATPVWWGAAIVVVGLTGAVLGGLRACDEAELEGIIAAAMVSGSGFACAGLGVALAARGADLPPLAALALVGALLQVLVQAVMIGLLSLCAARVRAVVGGTALASLGGLMRQMPATGLATGIAAASLAGLPPFAGFASLFLLFQALFAANRIGGLWLQLGGTCAVAACGLATALGLVAALRLVGQGFLGRSRSGIKAAEPGGDDRICMAALAGFGLLLGVWPGLFLMLARPAVRQLALAGLADELSYTFAPIAAVLVAAGAVLVLARRFVPGVRHVPAWAGGLEPGPSAALPVIVLRRLLLPALRAPTLRECLVVVAAVLALVLIVLAAR